jgi:hypothetical protein
MPEDISSNYKQTPQEKQCRPKVIETFPFSYQKNGDDDNETEYRYAGDGEH